MAQFQSDESALFISVLSLGEIRKGIDDMDIGAPRRAILESWLDTDLPVRFDGRIIGIDPGISLAWGSLSSELKRRGTPIGVVDALIAATALVRGLTVVTRNARHFRLAEVPCLNPWGEAG